ncbi:MAG: hypothetical protein ACOCV4_02900 [Myxococcota bacterium]
MTTLRASPDVSDLQLDGLWVGTESVLAAAGRRDAHGTHRRAADGAVIDSRWTKG